MKVLLALFATCAVLTPSLVMADDSRGLEVFQTKCSICHSANAADGNLAGPNLAGVVGRPVGKHEGFNYSDELAKASDSWTPDKLDTFLKAPGQARPGTIMPFAGLKKDDDRTALIDYLKTAK